MISQFKKISWIALIGIFFLIGYFHQHVLTFIYQHTIQAYVLANFGCKLNYENAYMDGNQLIIKAPNLPCGNHFKSAQMALTWHFNWKNREIHIAVDLEKPSWKLNSDQNFNEEKLKKVFKGKKGGLKYFFDLSIHDGTASWNLPDQSTHQVHFNAQTSSQSGGFIKAYFDQAPDQQHFVSIQTVSTHKQLAVSWECHEIECAHFLTFAKLFFPFLEEIQCTTGILKGKIQTIFPSQQRPFLVGEMILENVEFSQNPSFKGKIEKAVLKFEKNPDPNQLLNTIIQIDLSKPAAFSSYTQNQLDWIVDQVTGLIKINGNKMATIHLASQTHCQANHSHFYLTGELNLDAHQEFNAHLEAVTSESPLSTGTIRLSIHPLNSMENNAEIEVINLSAHEILFLQNLLATFNPAFKKVQLQEGIFDCLLDCILTKKGIQNVEIKRLDASQVVFDIHSMHAKGSFDQLKSKGTIQLAHDDPWETLNVDFHLTNGSMQLEGLHHQLPLTDIQAHVTIQNGAVQHSPITLKWMGLKGVMDLEWGKDKELLTFNLDGHVHDIYHLFPDGIQQAFKEGFPHSRLKILANFKRINKQLDLRGTLHVQRQQSDQFDLIHFGCEFKKIPHDNDYKWAPVGWLYGYHLPLEKFVSPFIFRKGVLRMSGNGEFRATFDPQHLTLLYDLHNLKIENENLLISAPDLRSDIPGQLMGYHQMDLNTYSHHGTLPVKQATYFEKNSGLSFTNINCLFAFQNQTLTINPIEAYCHGVFLAGNIFLDYSDPAPGVFSVKLDIPQMSGTFSQAQFILSHLDHHPPFLDKLPLEGEINSRNQGMQLTFDFIPHDYQLQANVETTFADGSLSFEEAELALKGLYMDLDYNHQKQSLEISDLQGTLLVGKPSKAEEYSFGGNQIHLHDLQRQDLDIDLWVKDHSKELLRFKAFTKEKEAGVKEIVLDPLSHFSDITADYFQCQIKDWTDVQSFKLKSNFELADLTNDLARFKNTGLYCFSHAMINKLSQCGKLSGKMALEVFYDPQDRHFCYAIDGQNLKTAASQSHSCHINGHKLEKKWIIDHLQWDQLIAHAELQPEAGILKIPFLGLNDGRSLLLGLEGDLFFEENYLQSKINLCEISLADLTDWPALKEYIHEWQPAGKLRASGIMRMEFLSQAPWFNIDADLLIELPHFSCKKTSFHATQPFHLHYKDNESIEIEKLQLNFGLDVNQPHLTIDHLNYDQTTQLLKCPHLSFQIPSSHLPSVATSLNRLSPNFVSEAFKEGLAKIKSDGELKGVLGFDKGPAQSQFFLQLNEGIYTFNQQDYNLKTIELRQINHALHFSTFACEEKCPYQVIGVMHWPSLESGEASFIDLLSNATTTKTPLKIKFSNDPTEKMCIQAMHGYFCGMHFNLKANGRDTSNQNRMQLKGTIEIDSHQITPLLTASVIESMRDLELSSIFTLNGDYGYDIERRGLSLLERTYFSGTVSSQEAILKGFCFQEIQAYLHYNPRQFEISSLKINDEAGKIQSDKIVVKQNEKSDAWWFDSPLITVKNFRPSLLRDVVEPSQNSSTKYKALLIKKLDFQNAYGKLSDVRTWQAKGNFHFLNPTRKNFNHPLLAIPAEIILRLGLNPQVLNPVTGTIFFDMQGDRFYLSRFKDVYSEGRGSKFYLAESLSPSWMDLKGNLNVQIKMKQYNLLFKLAELFTVSMEGNIRKPKFYLQKYKPFRKNQSAPFKAIPAGF